MKYFDSLRVPKYVQLMIRLREQIEQGTLKAGDPLPTRERLMKEYDLSLSTVTRAISELERQGWLISRQGSGTFVVKHSNGTADNHNESYVMGLLLPISNSYSSDLAAELAQEAQEKNVNLIISYIPDDEEIELNTARLFLEKEVNALIWCPVSPKRHIGVASLFGKNRIPVVICENVSENTDSPWICVRSDHYNGTKNALDYLFQLGHSRIAYVGPKGKDCDFGPVTERWNAYKEIMKERNLWNPDEWVIDPSLFKEWHVSSDQIRSLFRGENSPTAIIGFDDIMALEVVKGLRSFGIRIPEEVAVIGHGDYLAGQYSQPRLTTISLCMAEYVDTLFRALSQMLSSNPEDGEPAVVERVIVVPQRLLLRDSILPVASMATAG